MLPVVTHVTNRSSLFRFALGLAITVFLGVLSSTTANHAHGLVPPQPSSPDAGHFSTTGAPDSERLSNYSLPRHVPETGSWEQQSPLPTGATLNDVDMISANEGWAAGQYIGNGGVVVHTTDGGATWSYSTTGVEEPNYAVRFLDSMHGWVSSGNTVFYTTDGGQTWGEGQGRVLAGSFYYLEFATLNDGFTTTGIDHGYFRTTDGGVNWDLVRMPRNVADIQFFDANNGVANSDDGVYHSTDRGNSWTFTAGQGGNQFINHNLGFAVYENVSRRTTDGGATWQYGSLPGGAWVYDARFIDAQNGWATGAGAQILRTTDGGMTWNFSRLPDTYPYMVYDNWGIDFTDPAHVIAVGGFSGGALRAGGVIFRTSDAGATWLPGVNGSGTTTYRITALDANHAWAANDFGETLWTTNGGIRWNLASVPNGGEMRDIEFADTSIGWVVGIAGDFGIVARSTDGGRTWGQQFPNSSRPVYGVDAINSQTAIAVGGGFGAALAERTTDGGNSWTSFNANNGSILFDVFFINSTTGWIVGLNGKISKSTDGGQTWVAQNTPVISQLNQVSFADVNNGWAVGGFSATVLHTTNGGQNWTVQNTGLPNQSFVTGVSAVSPSVAWIATAGQAAPHVKRTTDGGATWVEDPTGTDPFNWWNTICFITPDYGWVGGAIGEPRGGILRHVPQVSTPTPTGTPGLPTSTSLPTFTAVATSTAVATCAPTVVSGSITSGDLAATSVLDWNEIASTCQVPKTCPPTWTGGFAHYDSYTFVNSDSSPRCVTVVLDGQQCGFDIEGVFSAAYLGSFNPNNACANYLADPGFYSDPFAEEATYSFNVPAGATFVVIVQEAGEDVGCYSYTLSVSGLNTCAAATPTAVATTTRTPTPGARLVGHANWQGRPGQPHPSQQMPITLTLKSGATEVNFPQQSTDANGFFTVSVAGLPSGTYSWRAKGPKYLANAGQVTVTGAPATNVEVGLLRTGDSNNDNAINVADFNIVKVTFGKSLGDPGYDDRADFTGDQAVNVADFNLLKVNFGQGGVPPIRPNGP